MTTNVVAPIETITQGQTGRAADRFSERCRTNAASLPKDTVQSVLEDEGDQLAQEMFECLRTRVERRANMIVRRVTVNRNQTPKQVVDATGRTQYVDSGVLKTMPGKGGSTEEVDVYFFKPGRYLTAEEVDREYELRGLLPDHYAQAQVNTDDPSFADEHPNGTQWNRDGKVSSCLTFSSWHVERYVRCRRSDYEWDDYWWFAGVRKVSK